MLQAVLSYNPKLLLSQRKIQRNNTSIMKYSRESSVTFLIAISCIILFMMTEVISESSRTQFRPSSYLFPLCKGLQLIIIKRTLHLKHQNCDLSGSFVISCDYDYLLRNSIDCKKFLDEYNNGIYLALLANTKQKIRI